MMQLTKSLQIAELKVAALERRLQEAEGDALLRKANEEVRKVGGKFGENPFEVAELKVSALDRRLQDLEFACPLSPFLSGTERQDDSNK